MWRTSRSLVQHVGVHSAVFGANQRFHASLTFPAAGSDATEEIAAAVARAGGATQLHPSAAGTHYMRSNGGTKFPARSSER